MFARTTDARCAAVALLAALRFVPCFAFVLCLHEVFMYLCTNDRFNSFLEGA